MVMAYYHSPVLPWTVLPDDEQRFRNILLVVLLATLIGGAVVPFLPVKEVPKAQVEMPPRLAKLVIERKKEPPPPKPKEEEQRPEPKEEKKPEPKPEPKPEAKPKPVPAAPEEQRVAKAREKARSSGVLAFSDDLADLRSSSTVDKLAKGKRLQTSGGEAAKTERSLIISGLNTGSGGIDTSDLGRNTGGTRLAGRQTSQVEAPVALAKAEPEPGKRKTRARATDEISLVFDQNKGKLDRLYQRALRSNPTLQGKIVLKLTIDPSGAVTSCEIVSGELGDEDLERKIVQRVKLINFGVKDVQPITITWPIEFFPA